jgi:hypothetical protein
MLAGAGCQAHTLSLAHAFFQERPFNSGRAKAAPLQALRAYKQSLRPLCPCCELISLRGLIVRAADLAFYRSSSQTFNDPVLEDHDQDDERDCDHH